MQPESHRGLRVRCLIYLIILSVILSAAKDLFSNMPASFVRYLKILNPFSKTPQSLNS
jgi:hypothetical protein